MPKSLALTDPEKQLSLQIEIYKLLFQLVGGITVIAGLIFTINQILENNQQFNYTVTTRSDSIALEQFEKAIEGLNSPNSSKRRSSVLTINSIATEYSEKYKQIANDVLITFLRDSLSSKEHKRSDEEGNIWPTRDKRLAIEFLSKQLDAKTKDDTDFSNLDLSNAKLPKLQAPGLNFRNANLNRADLSKSDLKETDFTEANLVKAKLTGSDLTKAYFKNAIAHDAEFTYLVSLKNAVFDEADLREAKFTATIMKDVSFR